MKRSADYVLAADGEGRKTVSEERGHAGEIELGAANKIRASRRDVEDVV